jgi:hypothetical protein
MAIMDDRLRGIVESIKVPTDETGLARTRGGLVRGVAWAELSGRPGDGQQGWAELRLHHRESGRLQAGLLLYRPLAQGGRTVVVGEATYDPSEQDADASLALDIRGWLRRLPEHYTR